MKESNGTTKKMECTCIQPYHRHFIITSLEESIEHRYKDIEMIKDNIENIRRTKGVEYAKYMEGMIDVHRLTQED